MEPQKLTNVTFDEEPRELTNVTFDEIQVGRSAELTVTLQQQQIDVAAIVSGDVDAFYVKGPEAVDVRMEPRKTEAAGAEALISILLGARLPGPGTKIVHRDLRFSGNVAAGDTLTAKVTAREKKEGNLVVFDCRCVNQDGKELVAGTVTVQAPTRREVFDVVKPPRLELRYGDAFAQLIQGCQGYDPVSCAIAHPCDRDSLMGAIEAAKTRLHHSGARRPRRQDSDRPPKRRRSIWRPYRIVSTPHSHASAAKAVELASTGEVEAIMKGSLHTDEIMGAIVPSSAGLRTSRRISHAFVMDVATYPKMFIMTDAAVNIFPDLEVKRDIIQNAIDLAPRARGRDAQGGHPLRRRGDQPQDPLHRWMRPPCARWPTGARSPAGSSTGPGLRQRHQRPGRKNQGDQLARSAAMWTSCWRPTWNRPTCCSSSSPTWPGPKGPASCWGPGSPSC